MHRRHADCPGRNTQVDLFTSERILECSEGGVRSWWVTSLRFMALARTTGRSFEVGFQVTKI